MNEGSKNMRESVQERRKKMRVSIKEEKMVKDKEMTHIRKS